MYKLVIVDDEPATRQGIRTALNWSLLNIEIAGEASNGLEALDLIERVHPDILICDIRMPKMDGISLVTELQSRSPGTQVLFLSGYSDKEYLKNAIRLDAVDYIFKPFELDELTAAVKKARDRCLQIRQSNDEISPDAALTLLEYSKLSASEREKFASYPIDPNGYFITVVIRVNQGSGFLIDPKDPTVDLFDIHMMVKRYCRSYREEAERIFGKSFVLSQVDSGYILHANISRETMLDDTLTEQLSRFLHLMDSSQAAVSVGVSGRVTGAENLKIAFFQARRAALSVFLTGYGQVVFHTATSSKRFAPSEELETAFYQGLNGSNAAESIDFLDSYINYMITCSPDDIPQIKDELTSIALRLHQKLKGRSNTSSSFVTEIINSALTVNDIKHYIMQLLEQHLEEINNLDNKGRLIFEAERYIIDHLDQELSIKKIAEQVFITPTYLCYLYKKNTGRTINQFILDVRMKKAKMMIIDTNLRIRDIAQKLGYSNQNYFTKTFTDYYGVNPSTFRNKSL